MEEQAAKVRIFWGRVNKKESNWYFDAFFIES